MANLLNSDIVVCEFELQPRHYDHFRSNTHGNGMLYSLIQLYVYIYTRGNKINNNDERTHFRKIYISHFIWKGYERVMCERWVGDWPKTATYWLPVLLSFAALLSRSAGLLNRGPEDPALCWELVRTASNCNNWLQTKVNLVSHRVMSLFDVHLLLMGVTSSPNVTRPQSRLCSDIFDRMHLFLDRLVGRRSIFYTHYPPDIAK